MTRARMTQILDLTLLAPDLQERVLFLDGETGAPMNERGFRGLVITIDWDRQRRHIGDPANPDSPPRELPGAG